MVAVLAVLFLLVPFVELYVLIQVSHLIGVVPALGVLLLVSVAGAWLVKQEGLGVLRRVQDQLARQRMPGRELVDGVLVLLAGALLLTPGFVTDAFGLLLLLPPVRAGVRRLAAARLRRRVLYF